MNDEPDIGELIDSVKPKYGVSLEQDKSLIQMMKEYINDITEVEEIDDFVLQQNNKKVEDSRRVQENWRIRKVLAIVKHYHEPLMNLQFFNPYLKRIRSMCHYQLIFAQFQREI